MLIFRMLSQAHAESDQPDVCSYQELQDRNVQEKNLLLKALM